MRGSAALAIVCACGHAAAPRVVANRGAPEPPFAPIAIEATPAAEAARLARAHAVVPAGATCLPRALAPGNGDARSAHAVLTIVRAGDRALACALASAAGDARVLGPVACWEIDPSGARTYRPPGALPGVSFRYHADGACPAGFCLPAGAAPPSDGDVDLAWSTAGREVAMVVDGHAIYLYDAATRAFERAIAFERDGFLGLVFLGDTIYVAAADEVSTSAWAFGADGRARGDLDVALAGGGVGPIDAQHLGLATEALASLVVIEPSTGARTTRTRAAAAAPPYVGVAPIAFGRDLLALLGSTRWGELVVLDFATLAEKRSLGSLVCPR